MTIERSVYTYARASLAVFRKLADPYGGFSNIACGCPIKRVAPPALGDFLMLGGPIGTVLASGRME